MIAALCLATSIVSCVLVSTYLGTDFDEIKSEIAENDQMRKDLDQTQACECCRRLSISVSALTNKFIIHSGEECGGPLVGVVGRFAGVVGFVI